MNIDPLSKGNPLAVGIGHAPGNLKEKDSSPRDLFAPQQPPHSFPNREHLMATIGRQEGIQETGVSDETSLEKSHWMRKTLAGFFVGTTLLGMAGCGNNPPATPTTEPSSMSTELSYLLINTKDEIELGNQVAAQIEKENKIWDNPEALARIKNLGAELAKTSSRKDIPYEFKLVDTDAINAFALPGGHIYVTRGLYNEFKDDREMTFVLGHEMGHVENRHSIKTLERDAAFRALIQLLTRKKGDSAEVIGQVASGIMNVRFSQKDEFQADGTSQRHMIRNGMNPWYGVKAMEHLKSLEKSSPGKLQQFFSTHPATGERIDNLKKGAENSPQP
jgi:beta-barrel assembly-enhancing protease